MPTKLNIIPRPGQTQESIMNTIETMNEWEYRFCKNRRWVEHVPDVEVIVSLSVREGKLHTAVRFQELEQIAA